MKQYNVIIRRHDSQTVEWEFARIYRWTKTHNKRYIVEHLAIGLLKDYGQGKRRHLANIFIRQAEVRSDKPTRRKSM